MSISIFPCGHHFFSAWIPFSQAAPKCDCVFPANLYKKLHTMQLEAPITRVIEMLLTAVTETINPETANLINQVRFAYINRDAITPLQYLHSRQTSMSDLRFSGDRNLENYGTLRAASQTTQRSRHAGTHQRVARRKNCLCSILSRLYLSRRKKRNILTKESRAVL